MEFVKGQVVRSRRGRDVTRWYAVVDVTGEAKSARVLCANGTKWTLTAPKHKNPQHLQPTNIRLAPEDLQTDQTLKAALKQFEQGPGQSEQGG